MMSPLKRLYHLPGNADVRLHLLVVALATVTLLLAGVLLGEVHMAGGMLVHEASVLLVILNGMRLLRI